MFKRVGDGQSTNIWHDKWNLNHPLGNPFTSSDNQTFSHVSELLTEANQWNEELIQSTFGDFDAKMILSTPVHGSGSDFWAWPLEKHGAYTVRSAYRLLEGKQSQLEDEQKAGSSVNQDWTAIWKLEVPP